MTNNQEISDLQSLIAHQDKQIQELNDVVTKQWAEIDALKKYMQMTKSKIQELEYSLGQDKPMSVSEEAAANKPPHY
ncbi:MAG: SlyX family protein [Alphaproteobacteria bacterium]